MEGCASYDMSRLLKPLFDWAGSIYMVSGLTLLTIGGLFLSHAITFIIFMLVSGGFLTIMFSFNFVYASLLEGSTTIIAVVCISCVVVAIAVTIAIQKYAKQYLVNLIGFMVGVLLTMAIL